MEWLPVREWLPPGAVSRHEAIEQLAAPDHAEPLTGHALLDPQVLLDGGGLTLQRVDHMPEPLHLVALARLLAPERDEVRRAVLAALHREIQREGERSEGGPAARGHNGYRSRPG